jgi:hypothetical protein
MTLVEGKAVAGVRRTAGDKRERTFYIFRGQVFPPVQDPQEHFSLSPISLEMQGVLALKPEGFPWKVNMVDAVHRLPFNRASSRQLENGSRPLMPFANPAARSQICPRV